MERTDQELVRIEKANRIREMGMDPFGHRFDRTHSSEDVREQYSKYEHDELENLEDKNKYITEIPIGKAIRASSSFPVVFSPCIYKNHKFLDGGILDNFPSSELKKQGVNKVLTVNFMSDEINEESSIIDIVMKTIDIMGNKVSEKNIKNSDMVLTIQTDKTGLLEVEKLDDCYKYGYRQTINNIDKIINLINN